MVVIARAASDTVGLSDTTDAIPYYFRSGGENLLASGVFATALTFSVSSSDTLALSDLSSGNISRSFTETIGLSDTADAIPYYFRSGGENFLASGVFVTPQTLSVSVDNTLALNDLASGNVSRFITETIDLSDTAEAVPYYFRSGGENLLASGVFTTSQTLSDSAEDTLALSDLASAETLVSASADDTLVLNDSAASNVSRLVDAANSLVLSDSSQGLNGLVGSSVIALMLSDFASEVAAKGVTSSESLTLVDLAVFAGNFSKNATDSFSLSDLADATVAYPVTAASELTLSDTSLVNNHLIVGHTFELSDFAYVVNQASVTLMLSDEATLVRDGQRSAWRFLMPLVSHSSERIPTSSSVRLLGRARRQTFLIRSMLPSRHWFPVMSHSHFPPTARLRHLSYEPPCLATGTDSPRSESTGRLAVAP